MIYTHHPRSRFERRMHLRRERVTDKMQRQRYPPVRRLNTTWRSTRRTIRRCCCQAVLGWNTYLGH